LGQFLQVITKYFSVIARRVEMRSSEILTIAKHPVRKQSLTLVMDLIGQFVALMMKILAHPAGEWMEAADR
jgi:hypothetical protein